MSDRPTPETDASSRWIEYCSEDLEMADPDTCRRLERERDEAREQRDALVSKFTKLDEPKYSGLPMLDNVIAEPNPEFRAWVNSLPPTYWVRYDLSAARIGWEAAKLNCNNLFTKKKEEL